MKYEKLYILQAVWPKVCNHNIFYLVYKFDNKLILSKLYEHSSKIYLDSKCLPKVILKEPRHLA
jgi:hypothetical protein